MPIYESLEKYVASHPKPNLAELKSGIDKRGNTDPDPLMREKMKRISGDLNMLMKIEEASTPNKRLATFQDPHMIMRYKKGGEPGPSVSLSNDQSRIPLCNCHQPCIHSN